MTVKAEPYDYELPADKAALIMIDFQKDFMLPGGFGDALGNKIELLKVRAPRARSMPISITRPAGRVGNHAELPSGIHAVRSSACCSQSGRSAAPTSTASCTLRGAEASRGRRGLLG